MDLYRQSARRLIKSTQLPHATLGSLLNTNSLLGKERPFIMRGACIGLCVCATARSRLNSPNKTLVTRNGHANRGPEHRRSALPAVILSVTRACGPPITNEKHDPTVSFIPKDLTNVFRQSAATNPGISLRVHSAKNYSHFSSRQIRGCFASLRMTMWDFSAAACMGSRVSRTNFSPPQTMF